MKEVVFLFKTGSFFNLIFKIVGDYMKMSDALHKEQKKKPNDKDQDEKINWSEIMGTNRQRLKRGKGGAMRRK